MTALQGRHLYEFADTVVVECPACHGRAVILRTPPARIENNRVPVRRLSCLTCTHSRYPAYPSHDFLTGGLRFWLETETRHGRFFALNYDHLDYIESYVTTRLRKVEPHPLGVRNGLITSRLPSWIKSAKNRAEILKIIGKLRRK